VSYREVRTVETCGVCGSRNHVFVCYSGNPKLNQPEAEYCFNCGETIKAETCLGIFIAAAPAVLEATVSAFKSGRLCSSLEPPAGVR
jgi:hypothetical protein